MNLYSFIVDYDAYLQRGKRWKLIDFYFYGHCILKPRPVNQAMQILHTICIPMVCP